MFRFSAILIFCLLAAGCAETKNSHLPVLAAPGPAGPEPLRVQTGRYSYVHAAPQSQQMDPLLAIIDVGLPSPLATIGDAADYLLKRSGYCLAAPAANTPEAGLLEHPIADVHRHLGPMSLRDALLALAGKAYELTVDDVYKEVGFSLKNGRAS